MQKYVCHADYAWQQAVVSCASWSRFIPQSTYQTLILQQSCVVQDAMNHSNFYLDAQKVGTLPADNPVIWRNDAMTSEVGPLDRDITGGYLQGGPAGNLKMTHPTAFSIALLAWGLIQFPSVRPHLLLWKFCQKPSFNIAVPCLDAMNTSTLLCC